MCVVGMKVGGEGVVEPDPYLVSHELGPRLKGDFATPPEVSLKLDSV